MSAPTNGSVPFEVPAWMEALGIKKREWLSMSKAQLYSQQRPDKPLKVQVWATGMLHSPGYKGQEATTMRGGKLVPLASGDIIKELWEVAKKYYEEAGIKATEAQLKALKETKEDIRRALVELEADGVAMRTDSRGTPLRELTKEQLRRLPSGRTRILFWLKPRAADPELVLEEWQQRQPAPPPEPGLPEEGDNPEVGIQCLPLPPIWKILNVLQIEKPEKAQIANPDYQKMVARGWAAARKVFMEVVAGCLPEVGSGSPPEVGNGGGAFESKAESRLVERPAAAAPSAPPSPPAVPFNKKNPSVVVVETPTTTNLGELNQKAPDPQFRDGVIAAFVDGGKPSPTARQILKLQQAIPDKPEARAGFVPYLEEKMPRIQHPGSLPSVAEEFNAAWPAILAREKSIQQSRRTSEPERLTVAALRAHLEEAAAAIPFPEIESPLRQFAADADRQFTNIEDLEKRLEVLEEKMIERARAAQSKQESIDGKKEIEAQLRPYRGKMTSDQIATLEKQYFERRLLEKAKLPRLSLFYAQGKAQGAGND